MFPIQPTRPRVIAVLLFNNYNVTKIIIITQNNVQQQHQQQQQHQNSTNLNESNEKNNKLLSSPQNNENSKISKSGDNEGILASPNNPATLRRLSQTDDVNNEVSWHKRVVVHRVPRSDASRSMFHAKGKESNNSNQCCIVL